MCQKKLCFWGIVLKAFNKSHFRICKNLISKEIINFWSLFCTCDNTSFESKIDLTCFGCVSSRKHWFPDDNSYINYNNGDNKDDIVMIMTMTIMMLMVIMIRIMVMMITMMDTVMIIKTTLIKMIMVMIIVMTMMISQWILKLSYTFSWRVFMSWF